MPFPKLNDAAVYYDGSNIPEAGVIEALNGTVADIRIDSDSRLEEACDLETGGYHPYRGYRQPAP